MNIEPNWTVTNQGPWQLIYNDTSIISLSQTIGTTSTEGKVFAGTQEDCEAERVRLNLPWASDVVINPEYQLIHKDGLILYYSLSGNEEVGIDGTSFLGTRDECDAEKNRLGLEWPMEDAMAEGPADDVTLNSEQISSNETGGIVSNTINFFKGLFG